MVAPSPTFRKSGKWRERTLIVAAIFLGISYLLGLNYGWSSVRGTWEACRFAIPAASLFLATMVQGPLHVEESEWIWIRWPLLLGNIALFIDWFIADGWLMTEYDWGAIFFRILSICILYLLLRGRGRYPTAQETQ